MNFEVFLKFLLNCIIVLFIVSIGFLFTSKLALAIVWTSPAKPVINGNGWIFVTIGDIGQADQLAVITISDPNSVTKQTCNITRNEYGYGRCKYEFLTDDISGTWTYTATSETGGNIEVGKITMSITDVNSLSSIGYGQQTTINVGMTYENVMPKSIVMRSVGRDLGTHTGRSDFVDIDGDGDNEIVVNDYNGRIWIWENIDRFYNEGLMLISGTDWRTSDVGTYHLSSGCVYEDFDGNGVKTIICGEYSGRLYAFSNVDMSAGYNVAYSHRTDDEGDSIRTAPVLCDVDNDGTADQIAVGIYQGYIVFYTFTDAGGFTQIHKSADLGTMHYGTRPLCGDFDGDGNNEWLVQDYYGGYRFYDAPTVSTVTAGDQAPDRGGYYGYGAVTDFDNDGKIEAVVPLTSGRFQLLEYDKSGTSELEEDLVWGTDTDWGSYAYGGGFLEIDDLNKNGRPDFISTDTEVQSIFTEYNPVGPDWYQIEVGKGYENSYVKPAYADFDGDGIKEVVIFGRYSGNVYIYQFNGEDWDLIYQGWKKIYGEMSGWGDGKLYGRTNGWLYTQECITGDIDDDDLEEVICFPYDGRALIYEQADRVEENVSPEIFLSVDMNDGKYEDPDDVNTEIRILNNGKLLALRENIAFEILDVVDEDNQNQGSLNPRWTDGIKSTNGVYASQNSADYSTIDASTVEEAVYSRIKLGQSYQVGAIKTWHYFADGRGYKNVIIRSTNDSTGDLCDFTTNDVLFDNSADGSNERYGEGRQGKSIYFDPVQMSCLRESTAGSSYWTTASNSGNHRTEIEIYETDDYASFNVYLDRVEDSSLAVKDNLEIDVIAEDRTGNLINISSQLTIPVTYDNLPFNTVIVGGTEYCPAEIGQIVIQLKDEFNDAVTGATCSVDYYYPDSSLWLDDQPASELSGTGVYYNSFTASSIEGVYIAIASCTDGSFTDTDSHTFHVSTAIVDNIWGFNTRTLTDYATSSIAQAIWGYTGSALDTTGNAITKIWDTATSTMTTAGSIGKLLVDNLDDKISNIAGNVWGYTTGDGRILTSATNIAQDIWDATTRKLTSRQIGENAEYIAGVTNSDTVGQIADATDQETIKYNVDLVRKATFDFAGLADFGCSTTSLVDAELTQPDDHWNDYELWMMSGQNIGEKRVILDFDHATHSITFDSAFTYTIVEGDQYVVSHERKLAHTIWNWSSRQLTSAANVAGDVWSYSSGRTLSSIGSLASDIWNNTFAPTRRLTDKTLTSGGNLATETYIDISTSTIITEINDNETLLNNLNNITAQQVWEYGTRDLTDYSTSSIALASADEVWNKASTALTETGSIGKQIADNLDVVVSTRSTLTAGDVWSESTRTLTDYSTSSIALAVWNNAQRTLTSYGNDITAGDVWNVLSSTLTVENSIGKQIADNVDTSISSRASTSSVESLQTDITYIRSKVDSIYTDTQYIRTAVDNILTKWGVYSASDIISDLNVVNIRIGTSTDILSDETLFGRTKYIQEKWGIQTAQTIYDKASSTLALIDEVKAELGYDGTSTTAYTDIQLVKTYVDELETYIGTPSDNALENTLFGKIKDVREKLDQLDALETKLDVIDNVVEDIRASQQLNYTVKLSDVNDTIETTKTYRAKLSIWDYENNPTNAFSIPTIVLYDATRNEVATSSMTLLSSGVYEYTYTVPSDAVCGLWESVVNVDLGGLSDLILNDYWKAGGSPAQVIINSMSDTIIPSISANVTISNEGNSGYEYQYEWCVVSSQDNECGGDDDIDYAFAAKYLNVDEDWTTELGLTVPNIGEYWFKMLVYYGTETSGASRMFTAVEEQANDNIPSQVNILKNISVNYQILEIYDELTNISSEIKAISGEKGYNLDELYTISQTNSDDLKYIINKIEELKAVIDINKSLIGAVVNQPVIQTWWTEGSIVLNISVMNPVNAISRIVSIKQYLPKEVRSEHIIEIEEELRLEYDFGLDTYFVIGEMELDPGKRKTFIVKAEDVFKIPEEELADLKQQTEFLVIPLENSNYFGQASILKSEIIAEINGILRQQVGQLANIERRISVFRDSQKSLEKIKENIKSLKKIISEVNSDHGILGSLFGISFSTNGTMILLIAIIILIILVYMVLKRFRMLEHHISDNKK